MLLKAVYAAMAVLSTMRLYADECDAWIRSQGVHGHSILADHFRRLAILIPQFAGDAFNSRSSPFILTARILLNELKQIQLYDAHGKV